MMRNGFVDLCLSFSIITHSESLIFLILLSNAAEAYYRLKTQPAITHVDLPLTPQQIRGSISTPKSAFRNSNSPIVSLK